MAEPFVGEIRLFSFHYVPKDWASCNGDLLRIADHVALFSLLGTMYGGDGRTTFALPDLRGRVPVNNGHAPGMKSYRQGEKWGLESQTFMYETDLPPHNHHLMAVEIAADCSEPIDNILAARQRFFYRKEKPTGKMADVIGYSGQGHSCENRQPSLVLNYCIALEGVFPPRT